MCVKCNECSPTKKKAWVFGCGSFFLVLALVLALLWPPMTKSILKYNFELREGSLNYNNWIETPLPMYLKIYLFNWTNPEAINDPNVKPNFVQMGPYVFLEKHQRVNLTWNETADTVSYFQKRTWHFVPELSNGDLSDKVTQIDVMSAATAYNIRDYNRIVKLLVNEFLSVVGKMTVSKTVGEMLFDGYDDHILDFLRVLKKYKIPLKIPFKRFGWFVERNESVTYDGRFEMYTGQQNFSRLGTLLKWNHKTRTPYFRGDCQRIEGTSGELWPMKMNATGDITFFVPDICRSVSLSYDQHYEHFGLTGSRWVADARTLDNGVNYPPNECYCTGKSCPDLLPGVQNMSDCRFGAPVFVSFPHFYLADPYYLSNISGLSPDRSKHEFSLALEPNTGIPLKVDAKLQINILLQPIDGISLYSKVPKIMIPAFWFEQTLDLDEKLANKASMALQLPEIGTYSAFGILGLGAILLCFGAVATITKKWTNYANLDEEHDPIENDPNASSVAARNTEIGSENIRTQI